MTASYCSRLELNCFNSFRLQNHLAFPASALPGAEILSIVRPAGETRPMVSQTDTID
jgi:hypothetical protein